MTRRIKVTSPTAPSVRVTSKLARSVPAELIAEKLGAERVDPPLDTRLSPQALDALRRHLHATLKSQGGRPRLEGSERRQKIPMTHADWERLEEIADILRASGQVATAGQIAAKLLHDAIVAVQPPSTAPQSYETARMGSTPSSRVADAASSAHVDSVPRSGPPDFRAANRMHLARTLTAKTIAFSDLLAHPEQEWLDWKAEFPDGVRAGRRDPKWEEGRAKILRALVSIANSVHDQCGYLVYGVDDAIAPRSVCGIGQTYDDADFQDWALAVFRPRVDFLYREEMHNGVRVGIFEIRPSSDWPHVCEQAIAGMLSVGQVWFRRGTRCTIAASEDLRRMHAPQDPVVVTSNDGPQVQEIRELWRPHGLEPYWPRGDQRAERLASGERIAYLPGTRREVHFANHVLMLRKVRVDGGPPAMRLSDFANVSRFEVCGGDRTHDDRILSGGRPYVSRVYRDKTTGHFYQVCADALEYRVGIGEDFTKSPWLRLES